MKVIPQYLALGHNNDDRIIHYTIIDNTNSKRNYRIFDVSTKPGINPLQMSVV